MTELREKLRQLMEARSFEKFITTIIALNAVTLGIETNQGLSGAALQALQVTDNIFLGIFVAEIAIKILVYQRQFFLDPWRVFDFAVVSVSLFPSTGPFSVVRALRVLRALRMVSVVPSLRKVVNGLIVALPGLGSVGAILALIFYVAAVMATKLFGAAFPEWFGSIGESGYTLFQVMTLESWSMGIVRPVMASFPYAWAFFLPFILVATFVMLNLFIAVIVNAMHAETEEAAEQRAVNGRDERNLLLEEVARLSQQVAELNRKLSK